MKEIADLDYRNILERVTKAIFLSTFSVKSVGEECYTHYTWKTAIEDAQEKAKAVLKELEIHEQA